MMIAIATVEAGSHVILDAIQNDTRKNTRRLSKTATLDGGSVIVDSGFSDSDRSFSFEFADIGPTSRDALWEMFQEESLVYLSCPEGVFSGVLESVDIENSTGKLKFSVLEKLTE